MPAPRNWHTYRLGARLAAIDGLVGREGAERVQRLQRALSSVVWMPAGGVPNAVATPTADATFVGRLMLGLLCRGWPTLSSPAVEEALLASLDVGGLGLALAGGAAGGVGQRLAPVAPGDLPAWEGAVLGALLRGDPRLEADGSVLAELCDSDTEKTFYRGELTDLFGSAIGWVELQRPFESLVREDLQGKSSEGGRVDFALELPGDPEAIQLIVELDGPHHDDPTQKAIDWERNERARQHGWTTLRVRTCDHRLDPGDLKALRAKFESIKQHNAFPFTHFDVIDGGTPDAMLASAARLLLTPHAVARVELALARSVMDGWLRLEADAWSVAVAEREVPCAELAVRDFLDTLIDLCGLYGIPFGVRRVRLLVAREHLPGMADIEVAGPAVDGIEVSVEPLAEAGSDAEVDLAVDVSVEAHPTRRYPTDPLSDAKPSVRRTVRLRTAQRQSGYEIDVWPEPRAMAVPAAPTKDQIKSAERAAYEERLCYFLQLLFRKKEFREGQLPIIDRVLARQDVIGLLPTGAGKSITFQLPALLSSGMALVIDPLKSLMQDQVENLGAVGIDDAIQINSDTPTEERGRIEWQFARGEFRMVFISPERLQIQTFRDLLRTATGSRPVSYLVIDEAHCVSEWGHDFRTAYLNLGRIAARYCVHGGKRPPFVALTGTASEAVLRDVRRELDLDADDPGLIIRPASFDRPELRFEIIRVAKDAKAGDMVGLLSNGIPLALSRANDNGESRNDESQVTVEMLAEGSCGGIVFCPHRNGDLGVLGVRSEILGSIAAFRQGEVGHEIDPPVPVLLQDQVSIYAGEEPDYTPIPTGSNWSELKQEIQRAFKRGDVSLLVTTNAFGMGIDKPNIRYTVHYAMPPSVEALAQEAGRAGRDRKPAICAVLFTDRLDPEFPPGNKPVPADCLELGISTEEARERQSASGWDSDDAEMQMFLHGRSHHGVASESLAVRDFYARWVEPRLLHAKNKGFETIGLTLDDAGAFPGSAPVDRPDVQRVVYRLSLLGIVDDYTIQYRGSHRIYTIALRAQNDDEVIDNLRRYVLRYQNDDLFGVVQERMDESSIEGGVVDRAIYALVWFVYEQIERRRRAAMYGVRQLARESLQYTLPDASDEQQERWGDLTPGQRFKQRMNEQLGFGSLTEAVFDVVRENSHEDPRWWELADRMSNAEEADRVRLQARRAMEDAPEHPGLLILEGLGALASGIGTVDEAATSLAVGLREASKAREGGEAERLAERIVDEVFAKAPGRADLAVREVLRRTRIDQTASERGVPRAVAAATYRRTADGDSRRVCAAVLLEQANGYLDKFLRGGDGG